MSQTETPTAPNAFEQLGLHPHLVKLVSEQGYTTPTAVQAQAIPSLLKGHDLLGLAPTGTGKTAAFALPIIQRLMNEKRYGVSTLILTPTRELADQVTECCKGFAKGTPLKVASVYGGVSFHNQVQNLKRGVDILVACPGRLLDHLQQKTVTLNTLQVLILDEADQMFDMGFFPTIKRIIATLPKERQTLLFSATMPNEIRSLAMQILHQPVVVEVEKSRPVESVSQTLYPVSQDQKSDLLRHLLKDIPAEESVLVFTRTKHRAKRLGVMLDKDGHRVTSLQGNLSQNARKRAMDGFRSGEYQVMVATDIAARGIDVSQVFHVINFDVPETVEAYTHRIGRTGRASRTGKSYTFFTSEDVQEIRAIERRVGRALPRQAIAELNIDLKPLPESSANESIDRPDAPRGGRYGRSQGGRSYGGRSQGNRSGGGQGGGGQSRGNSSYGRSQRSSRAA